MLWVSVLLVTAFAPFPSYVARLFGSQETSSEMVGITSKDWVHDIQGMTCAGCEATSVAALSDVLGVKNAVANFEEASASRS